MKIRVADFCFQFSGMQYPYLERFCRDYIVEDNKEVDAVFLVSEEDILEEQRVDPQAINRPTVETTVAYRKTAGWLPLHSATVMHGTFIDVDGTGVLFTALSGTGKTTHMLLWQKLLGDRLTIVNGDKPIMRFLPEGLFGYGTPWNGKEKFGCNMRSPLKHICFIERSKTNYVESISKSDAVARLVQQVYMPKDSMAVAATFSLVDRILDSCQLWIIHCNMELQAAEVAYNAIMGTEEKVGNEIKI